MTATGAVLRRGRWPSALTRPACWASRSGDEPGQPVLPVGQRRQPAQAQRHVVEHRVGRAGRQRGGSSSAVPMGSDPLGVGAGLGQDRPHETPPGRGAAVGHVEDAGPAVEPERHDGRRQVGREGGRARAGRRRSAARPRRRPGAVRSRPCWRRGRRTASSSARWWTRAGTRARPPAWRRRRPRSGSGRPTPGRGGRPCRRRRSRWTRRRRARPPGGRLGDVAGPDGVDGVGAVDLGLAPLDRGEGPAVEHELGPERGEGRQDGVPVVDRHGVDVGAPAPRGSGRAGAPRGRAARSGGRRRARGPPGSRCRSRPSCPSAPVIRIRTAQLAPAPQDPSAMGARARSGSHQSRWSAYHATVSASPCSHSTDGAQPSSLRSLEESRT